MNLRVMLATFVAIALLLLWSWSARPFGDFTVEAARATSALGRLDFGGFFAAAPAYGASLLLRAPFAVLGDLTGSDTSWRYLWLTLPAAGALGWFAFAVGSALRQHRILVTLAGVGIVALNPLAHEAVALGHAEELMVGACCVGAVLAAGGDRPIIGGLLLGAAAAGKPWAIIAGPPVLWAARDVRQMATIVFFAAAAAGALVTPFLLFAPGTVRSAATIARSNEGLTTPFSIWFVLERGILPAAWVQRVTHPLALSAALALPAALALTCARRRSDALLVLALALIVRCLLDTWTIGYYALPPILALVGWEAIVRGRAPVIAGGLTCTLTLTMTGPLSTSLSWAGFIAATASVLVLGVWTLRRPSKRAAHPATPAIASTASA